MNNENNILAESENILNEIKVIRKMFSEEELSAFDNFVNSQHPQICEPEHCLKSAIYYQHKQDSLMTSK